MSFRASTRLFFLLATITVCTTLLHANAISGSIPFAGFSVTESSTNLKTSTTVTAGDSLTSGMGSGDFSIVPVMTSFGPFTLTDTMVMTGGGFSISNASFGSFVAAHGNIVAETPTSLVVDLIGTYTPGSAFGGLTPTPAEATVAYTNRGTSVSASFTLVAVPEPGTMVTMGIGLCGAGLLLRRKLRHE